MRLSEPKPGETLGFELDDGTGLRVAQAGSSRKPGFPGRCSTATTASVSLPTQRVLAR